jgi:hypothetical protein
MNSDSSLNKSSSQILTSKFLEEMLLIISPGLWMLLTGSSYARWNSVPLILFGSILITCGYVILRKTRGYKKHLGLRYILAWFCGAFSFLLDGC